MQPIRQAIPAKQKPSPGKQSLEAQKFLRSDTVLTGQWAQENVACPCEGTCPRCTSVQAKAKLETKDDPSEREADQIAEKIISKPLPAKDSQPKETSPRPVATKLQPQPINEPDSSLADEELEEELPDNGKILQPDTQAWFETQLGQDLSRVRIHTGDQANQLATLYQARAFTYKNHIVFNQGEYAPDGQAGQKLLAHEMVHVVQQRGGSAQSSTVNVAPSPIRIARTPNEELDERIEQIDSLLSYGVFDWAITDAEATEAMALLRAMTNSDRSAALRRINIERLRSNIPDQYRLELAVMLIAGQDSETVLGQIRELLSYGFTDWAITDAEATHVFNMLSALSDNTRDQMLDAMGRFYRRRLYENLPSDVMREQFMRFWDERSARMAAQQQAQTHSADPPAVAERTPVEQKYHEFQEFIAHLPIESAPESPLLVQPRHQGPLPDERIIRNAAVFSYNRWIDREQNSPEFMTISPADLYGRIYGQILNGSISSIHREEDLRRRVEAEGRHSLDKYNEFQDFIRNRLDYINSTNETEARVQETLLREFIQWTAAHQNTPEFQTADPMQIYEQIGRHIITPEMDRDRMRAASSPQGEAARQAKLDEFLAKANELRERYRAHFPYRVPVASQGRDILVWDDPAVVHALDAMAGELTAWAMRHYNDGDFTSQSPTVILATIVQGNQAEYRDAQLMPLLTESIIRTDIDPAQVAESFVSSLGQVLLASAIIGVVVGAELFTVGQVTWILLALAAAYGTRSFIERREEIENGDMPVPVVESVVHSAGDVVGLSQLIEGITGVRLGTGQQLNSVQRSESLGSGAGQIVGVFVASRAFRAGRQRGVTWRQRIMGTATGGPPPIADLLPGPREHFPFSGQGQPFPIPERPNCVYRIMNLAEAAEALRTNRLPASVANTSGQKYFTLDSRYAMLFRERNLAQVELLGQGLQAQEANLARLDARIAEVRAQGNPTRLAELETSRTRLANRLAQETSRTRQQAQSMIDEWFFNPDQSVVVEIELNPGALDHIFTRAVHQSVISQYTGQNVYIWLVERGYGRNIAVPPWQLSRFNSDFVRGIRLHSTRAPFGQRGISTDPGHTVTPSGGN